MFILFLRPPFVMLLLKLECSFCFIRMCFLKLFAQAFEFLFLALFGLFLMFKAFFKFFFLLFDNAFQFLGLLFQLGCLPFYGINLLLGRCQVNGPKLLQFFKLAGEILDFNTAFYDRVLLQLFPLILILRQQFDQFGNVASDFAVVSAGFAQIVWVRNS